MGAVRVKPVTTAKPKSVAGGRGSLQESLIRTFDSSRGRCALRFGLADWLTLTVLVGSGLML